MSKDLISRKALVAALIEERNKFPPETAERYSFGVKLPSRFNQAMRGGIRKALRLVETTAAIDAEPVRHGRWVQNLQYDEEGYTYLEYRCSECDRIEFVKEPYCHCGAKMRGENECSDG